MRELNSIEHRIEQLEDNTAEQQAKIDYLLEIVEGLLDQHREVG